MRTIDFLVGLNRLAQRDVGYIVRMEPMGVRAAPTMTIGSWDAVVMEISPE